MVEHFGVGEYLSYQVEGASLVDLKEPTKHEDNIEEKTYPIARFLLHHGQ